ncbi:hypothetical protein [Piscinibacter sp. XHJ-5]|uniref:hypothetical protein n=1 Tax=Piscinibacter sp. XHJ-5 TaxID=3037797 RepID=UPI0024529394|nr:hypothetical protein [Piscinibacter sp. XHJ-5]
MIFMPIWLREPPPPTLGPIGESFKQELSDAFEAIGLQRGDIACNAITKKALLVTCHGKTNATAELTKRFMASGWYQRPESLGDVITLQRGEDGLYIEPNVGRVSVSIRRPRAE